MSHYDPEHMPPVLPQRTHVAWTYGEVMEVAASGVDAFVRRTRLKFDTDQNPRYLNDALRIADMAIQQTATSLGVEPVNHRWFLYHGASPGINELYDSSSSRLVPRGFSLVALVENIHPTIQPSPVIQAALAQRISRISHLEDQDLILDDLNMEHVVFDVTGKGHLVDVDAEIVGKIPDGLLAGSNLALLAS